MTAMRARWPGRRLTAWEATLVVLILLAAAWSARLSPYYLALDQILESTRQFIIPGLLALGLTIVVLTGEIDISLASTLAVGAVLFARLSAHGLPLAGAIPIVIACCAALGALNGFLVARLGLPSLAVTLGTMGAYRGLAFIIGSETGYTDFDGRFTASWDPPTCRASFRYRSSSSLSSPPPWRFSFTKPFLAGAVLRSAATKKPR